MTVGAIGAVAAATALVSDVAIAGLTFVFGTWIKDRKKKQPVSNTQLPREYAAILGGAP